MKVINHRDLPPERLATTTEDGSRAYIFPASVKGFFNRARTQTQFILIALFLYLPWIKIGGHQAVLLDIKDRQFALFGLTFWAHDTPILFFVILIAVILLAVVTAIWGRVWCGWGCPQTVFIEGVFRKIEAFVVGNHLEQIKLAKMPLDFKKVLKVSSKWGLYLLVSLIISHSFLAYFVGVDELKNIMTQPPIENWTTFLIMLFLTAVIAFDFGWFREQFCIIMCPYGRIQAVLMDENSLAVIYDEKRGEPRGKMSQSSNQVKSGDCIDCFRCVSVCPTGIDIRRGVQMECIACTACIDACNEVMEKINKPKNLIQYSSVAQQTNSYRKVGNVRVFIYLLVIAIGIGGLTYAIQRRQPVDISILRGHDKPYSLENESDKQSAVLNHFKLHIKNQEFETSQVSVQIAENELFEFVELINPVPTILLKPGELLRIPFFIRFKIAKSYQQPVKATLVFTLLNDPDKKSITKEVVLAAPL